MESVTFHDRQEVDGPLEVPKVLCCVCGLLIDSNPSNMCLRCIRRHVDITDGLQQRDYIIVYCPECERYLQPPKYWSRAELESRELMTLCLKRIKGLSKYNLVNAAFIWTEPHSKRLKVKLAVQKEIFANTVVQQEVQIDYEVLWQQCPTCQKVATGQPQWDAVVQLRQKVDHKRTMLYLEQVILKHRMHEDVIRIQSHPDGLDFFYSHKSHAMNFVDFLNNNAPCTRRDAVQLVSHDSKSNTAVQHHTFSLEIAPLCREDIVVLPPALYSKLGGIGPVVVVHKVYSSIVFLDPRTLRAGEITGTLYWKSPFNVLASTRVMTEFYVLDVSLSGLTNGIFQLAMVTVCLSSEVGEGREWIVSSHLGGVLNPGDYCKGYLLENMNVNSEDLQKYKDHQIQDVILIRKHYPTQMSNRHRRNWKLKKLDVVEASRSSAKQQQSQQAAREQELAEFEDEIERDAELRRDIRVYKVLPGEAGRKAPDGGETADDAGSANDDESPQVQLEELLDELKIDANEAEAPVDTEELTTCKKARMEEQAGSA